MSVKGEGDEAGGAGGVRETGRGWLQITVCQRGLEALKGAETLKPLWQRRAQPRLVDLFESAVKHRAGGFTAQRVRKRGCRGALELLCKTEG